MTLTCSNPGFGCVLTLLVCLAGCAATPKQMGTERYFTWVDENGVLRHSPIHKQENELLQFAQQQRNQQSAQELATDALHSQAGSVATGEGAHLGKSGLGKSPSDSSPEPSRTVLNEAPKQEDYSIDSYVDAAELQRKGFIRESDGAPFYVWTDINGVVHSSPYPSSASVETSSAPSKAPKISPFLHEERISAALAPQLQGMDEFARKLFKLDGPSEGMLAMLAANCCQWLNPAEAGELDIEEGYLIKFSDGQEQHGFVTGRSAYQLVRLPDKRTDYMLRLRSFVNRDVLYPSLVLLDKDLNPVRMVRRALYDFEPENWFRYGYLEGWVKIEPRQGDTYLLVMTVAEDMKTGTWVEHKKKTLELRHVQTGLLHLALP